MSYCYWTSDGKYTNLMDCMGDGVGLLARLVLGCLRVHQCKFSTYTPWKTNGLPLKINDWKMYFLLK